MNKTIWVLFFIVSAVFLLIGIPFLLAAIEHTESLVDPSGLFGWRILLCVFFVIDSLLLMVSCLKLVK